MGKPTARISEEIDTLAIDMNGIFHDAAQRCYKYGKCAPYKKRLLPSRTKPWVLENRFFALVGETIEFYRQMTNPRKKLLLCVDGVAGAAKMGQQRQRRFRNSDTTGMPFNPNCLTPGTEIMDKLTYYVDWYIKTQITCDPNWASLEVIFSNEKVPGEGEHKIIRYMRSRAITGEKICIHGMDADLIMLGLAVPVENVFILRDDSFNENLIHFVDLRIARSEINSRLISTADELSGRLTSTQSTRKIKDFVLMCYCVGNDFLPQVPGIEILQGGIDTLISSYCDLVDEFGSITRAHRGKEHLSRKAFADFLHLVAELELPMFEIKIKKLAQFFKDPILESALAENADRKLILDLDKYKKAYYEAKFPGVSVEKICHEYIKGMRWVLHYYTTGIPCWSWFYPWDYSPFISDIAAHFDTYKSTKFPKDKPFLPFQQLITVLPPESNYLIIPELRPLVSREHPKLGSFFPTEIVIDLAGKRREWEGIAKIPKPNYEVFMEEYSKITIPDTRSARRNRPGKSYLYVYSDESRQQKSPWGRATFQVRRIFYGF